MSDQQYIEITIPVTDESLREQLIARLDLLGFEGFEESDTVLKAYSTGIDLDETVLNKLLQQHKLSYSKSIINKQNWNELWESNFDPVQVDDFVGIRAGFHAPLAGVAHEIVITPKMSFGTGHHATTWLVMQMMRHVAFQGRSVFDFGTGTGILAILAEKLGANRVLAVDNDPWCIENASENISINNCINIDIQLIDMVEMTEAFDIVLANINRNIILENLTFISASVTEGGILVLSGLLVADEDEIRLACDRAGFRHLETIQRNGWIAARFCRLS